MPVIDRDQQPFRVLLVNLNRYDQPYPVYPLGLACIDGALRSAGHVTRILDSRLGGTAPETAVRDFHPDLIGISLRNIDNVQAHNPRSFIHDLIDVCRQLRASSNVPIVIGGSGFSVFPREIYELTGVEYGISGEGERPILDLVSALRQGTPAANIGSLWTRDAAGRAVPPTSVCGTSYEGYPHHDPELLNAYLAQGSLPGVQTQRGCPLHCCYCTYPLIEGRLSRFKSGEETAEEFRRLASLGTKYVFIVDSVFNTRAEHVLKTCEALIRADLKVEWECFLRPRGVTREMLQLMKRAGLRHVEFGSDSLSDPVLERYGKSFRYEDVKAASEIAHALKVRYSHFIIFGGPGETPATVEETIARSLELPGSYFFGTIGMRVYPGTPLWKTLSPETKGERAADYLIEPRFHLEPHFTTNGLLQRLQDVQRSRPNWAVGDPPPVFVETMAKLRKRGVYGPMWEYAELIQRLQPKG